MFFGNLTNVILKAAMDSGRMDFRFRTSFRPIPQKINQRKYRKRIRQGCPAKR